MTVRIVVADDNADFLEAAREVLAAAPGLDVVAAVRTGADALAAAAELRPDLIVLDVEMPGGGPALAEELSRRHPSVRLMCLSARDDPDTVLAMLGAGCAGVCREGRPGRRPGHLGTPVRRRHAVRDRRLRAGRVAPGRRPGGPAEPRLLTRPAQMH